VKILLDTNILINVILSPSKASASYKVFELCSAKKLEPQLGCALFNEYEDLFHRPEIQAKSVYTGRELEKILDGFLSVCKWHKVSYLWRPNLSDEADNHLIDLAVASNTQWIITQNIKDLSSGELKFDFQAISPDNFLENIYGNNYLPHH
jgi:putative PIN family toxin of toxin-antitoxin system